MRQNIGGLLALLLVLPLLAFSQNAQAQFTLSEAKEIAAFPLTLDKLEKKYRISIAMARQTSAGARNDTAQKNADQSLDDQIRTLKLMPNFENLCHAEGLSVREYVLITMAINVAMYPTNNADYRAHVARNMDDPIDVAAPPDHVLFVQQHLAEIQNGMKEISAARKAAKAGGK
jgi:hypothetical protein